MPVDISSRTPEGELHHCPVCGAEVRVEPSGPAGDAPCPNCGVLLWFNRVSGGIQFIEARALAPIFVKVCKIIAAYLDIKEDEITLLTPLQRSVDSFKREVGIDSLDMVEIVMKLEEEFQASLQDMEAEEIETVWDLCALILTRLPGE